MDEETVTEAETAAENETGTEDERGTGNEKESTVYSTDAAKGIFLLFWLT